MITVIEVKGIDEGCVSFQVVGIITMGKLKGVAYSSNSTGNEEGKRSKYKNIENGRGFILSYPIQIASLFKIKDRLYTEKTEQEIVDAINNKEVPFELKLEIRE